MKRVEETKIDSGTPTQPSRRILGRVLLCIAVGCVGIGAIFWGLSLAWPTPPPPRPPSNVFIPGAPDISLLRGAPSMGCRPQSSYGISCAGLRSKARTICYVLDCSELMKNHFEAAKMDALRSIWRMGRGYRFHTILFGGDTLGEPQYDRPLPVKVTDDNKIATAKYFDMLAPAGQGGAVAAICRAYEVLNQQIIYRPGRAIFFLPSKELPDGVALLAEVKALAARQPADKPIKIYILFYGTPSPQTEAIAKRIVKLTDGKYRIIPPEEMNE